MQDKVVYLIIFFFIGFSGIHAQSHFESHPHSEHQSPYAISWKKESKFIATGAALLGTSFYLKSQYGVLTDAEILGLDATDINSFDRKSIFNNSASAKTISDYFAFGSIAIPLFFISEKRCRLNTGHIVSMWLESNLLTFSITEVAKHSVRRARPYVYNDAIPNSDKQDINSRLSFFSGHVAQTSVNSFFAAKVFSDYFPDSKIKELVWATAIVLPAVTAYGRVKAGRHFPTDAITGYLVGATIGVLVPSLHRVSEENGYTANLAATGNGILFRMEF